MSILAYLMPVVKAEGAVVIIIGYQCIPFGIEWEVRLQPEYTGFLNFAVFFIAFFLVISGLTFAATRIFKLEGKAGGRIARSVFIGLGTALAIIGVQSLLQRLGVQTEINRALSFALAGMINLCLIYILLQVTWKRAVLIWLLPLLGFAAGWIYLHYR